MENLLVALGLTVKNIVIAAITSFVGLKIFDGASTKDRWVTFIGGFSVAAWGAGPLREYLELKPGVEAGIVIILGIFSMALATEGMKVIRTTDWTALLKKRTGG